MPNAASVKGAAFEDLAPPDNMDMARARLQSGLHLPQMSHCARCRADAVGLISEGLNEENMGRLNRFSHADVLGGRGIPNRVDDWGPGVDHDWPTWRAMLPHYLGALA